VSDTEYISKDAFITQQRKQYCENCERRKGTKNGKRIFVYEIGEAPCRACDIEDMIDAVWDFLPADVAPVVHGHWKYEQDEGHNIYTGECSVCGYRRRIDQFCGRCGAKMDESEDSGNE
jgi:NADH pyrophosphatase NudC (nudix superfamily)